MLQGLSYDNSSSSTIGKTMSIGNKKMVAQEVCNDFLVYDITAYGCSNGNHMPWDTENCAWNSGEVSVPPGQHKGGYDYAARNIVVCYTVNYPDQDTGGGSGGGGTTPNPPDGYDPCECGPSEPVTVSAVKNNSGLKLMVAAPNCCDEGGGDLPPLIDDENPFAIALQNFITELQITDSNVISFLANNQNVFTAIKGYLGTNGWTPENKQFAKWAVGYLTINNNKSVEQLDNDYDPIRYQNYIPRDRAPTSYPRRTSLSNSDGSDNFSSLTETTPLYNYSNGVATVNLDAFNCHYHTFGLQYATKVDDEHPKWVIAIALKSSEWEQVIGNSQVGDRVLYYKNYNDKSAFVHSAIVIEVDADGYATKVSSKMGPYEIITHHPRDIPVSYGSPDPTFVAESKILPSRIYWRKK